MKFKLLSKRKAHDIEHDIESGTTEDSPLRERIVAVLRSIYDPEIPVNIYDLGLIYDLLVDEATGTAHIRMTLTAPGCPVAETFPGMVERSVEAAAGVSEASVEIVWEPPWTPDRMTEAARVQIGLA